MDEHQACHSSDSLWDGSFAHTLATERDRALSEIDAQLQQLDLVERNLESQLAAINSALSDHTGDLDQQRTDLERRESQLRQQLAENASQQQAASERLRARQDELRQQEDDLESAGTKLRQAQRALMAAQDEHDAAVEQLSRRRARLDEQTQQLDYERDQLASQLADTKSQRRRIAQEFKQQRAQHFAELENQREALAAQRDSQAGLTTEAVVHNEQLKTRNDELLARSAAAEQSQLQLQQQLRGREDQLAKLNAAFQSSQRAVQQCQAELQTVGKARDEASKAAGSFRAERDRLIESTQRLQAESSQRQAEQEAALAELRTLQTELQAALDQLRLENQQLTESLQTQDTSLRVDQAAVDQFQADYAELATRLTEAEHLRADAQQRLAAAPLAAAEPSDLQRRFELAVDDVRQLKRQNSELEEKLNRIKAAGPNNSADGGALDWESQKRRLLAALEADDTASEHSFSKPDRLTIEGTVRITDDIVSRKDREIADLKQLLEHQSGNIGEVSVGVGAFAAAMDNDEIIVQQRQLLQEMQDEWRAKMRQAEIDISLERARLARDKVELEDRLRDLEDAKCQLSRDLKDATANGKTLPKPARGRWLSRLGLKDDEEG